ncbi:MAG TPA: TIM-barrel domain-containing protein [Armatimonadota bacterium]|jgi:hypothetical protein
MQYEEHGGAVRVSTFHYCLDVDQHALRLDDPRTGHRLLDVPTALALWPSLAGEEITWHGTALTVAPAEAGPVVITVSGETDSAALGTLTVTLSCYPEYIEVGASCAFVQAGAVAHWNLLAPGTHHDFFHAHHWRNRHGHTATFETYNLYQGGQAGASFPANMPPEMVRQWTEGTKLSTFSTDFMYAPRPSFFLLQRDTVMLGIGARDLPQGFGLEFASGSTHIDTLRFNYGGDAHGLPYVAGEVAEAPRLYLLVNHEEGVWESVDHYVARLQEDGMAPRKSTRNAPHWWTRPLYCTWNDQGFLSGNGAYYSWPGDNFVGKDPIAAFDGAMLDTLLDTLERDGYPVGGVIIDAGWETVWGEWHAHPQKFPDLRAQIERIHTMGLRALLWIAPFDFAEGCAARQHPEWLAGGGVLGKWGSPLLDYSNPRAQEEYARPLMRYFFSDEPGCLNADGMKTDFMADKIFPEFPVYDRAWRGEERFILHTLELFYAEMRRYKPDGMMLGSVVHPCFIGCQDLIRTYDVPFSQRQHADRNVFTRHFNPGNLVSLDLCETRSLADVEEHLRMAQQGNMSYELGRIAVDPATGEFALGPDYLRLLKRKLPIWK